MESRVARTEAVGLVPMTRVCNGMILRNHVGEGKFDSGEQFNLSMSIDGRYMVDFADDETGTYYYVSPQDLSETAYAAWRQRLIRVASVCTFVNKLKEAS